MHADEPETPRNKEKITTKLCFLSPDFDGYTHVERKNLYGGCFLIKGGNIAKARRKVVGGSARNGNLTKGKRLIHA